MTRAALRWGLLCLIVFAYATAIHFKATNHIASDFSIFYETAHDYVHGKPAYHPTRWQHYNATYRIEPLSELPHTQSENLNPPLFVYLSSFIGRYDFVSGFYLWEGLSLLAGLTAILLIAREQGLTSTHTLTLVLGFVIYFPTYTNVLLAQIGLWFLLFSTVIWCCIRRGYARLAGIVLGILCSLKLFAGLWILYFLVKKHWQVAGLACLSFVAAWLLPLPFLGLSMYQHYYANLHHIAWYACSWNASLMGSFHRLFIPAVSLPTLTAQYVTTTCYAGSCIAVLFFWLKAIRRATFEAGFALTLIAMLLLSPLGWIYYFPAGIFSFFVLLSQAKAQHYPWKMTGLIAVLLLATSFPMEMRLYRGTSQFIHLTRYGYFGYALLFWFILMVITILRPKAFTVSPEGIEERRAGLYGGIGLAMTPSGCGVLFSMLHILLRQ